MEGIKELVLTTALQIVIIFFLPILITEILRKKKWFTQWSLKRWWLVFLGASTADIASTFFFIYVRSVPWEAEMNIVVRFLGPLIGYVQALMMLHLVVLILFYLVASHTHQPTYHNLFLWLFCIASGIKFGAAVCNVVLS